MSISKVYITLVLIFTCWYLKLRFVSNSILAKNAKKQPLCYVCAKLTLGTLSLAITNVCTSNKSKRHSKSTSIPLIFSDNDHSQFSQSSGKEF